MVETEREIGRGDLRRFGSGLRYAVRVVAIPGREASTASGEGHDRSRRCFPGRFLFPAPRWPTAGRLRRHGSANGPDRHHSNWLPPPRLISFIEQERKKTIARHFSTVLLLLLLLFRFVNSWKCVPNNLGWKRNRSIDYRDFRRRLGQ